MHLSDWIGLLNTCALIGDGTGVTLHAAKLAYARSLCVVVDDQGQWSRAVCLTKCDFMEALTRLAEELAPPPLEEVAEAMREVGITGRRLRVALEQPWTYYYNEVGRGAGGMEGTSLVIRCVCAGGERNWFLSFKPQRSLSVRKYSSW
ncbi:hypothetical protein Vretimale_12606 [Volvox reticuliferus]|uniref:Uncharacterized protein n=1 Tax=Volvox reticuliferus TaxID=1737510 RepID=A0A8J4GKJ0_9CHLO|nr:hypothetical protein Vretimale_12606 [Volvox reticuliferus]